MKKFIAYMILKKAENFKPDFLLFLETKEKIKINDNFKTKLYYQIFIEPKGNQFKDSHGGFTESKEGWKQEFLQEISDKYGCEKIIEAENPNYRLFGLPFFNVDNNQAFQDKYFELINNIPKE